MVATKGRPGEIYNIGGGAEIANVDLAKKILTLMGSDASQIEYTPDRKGHDFRYSLDYSKVREEIGYLPLISFETGLQSTIDWYKKNKEWWSPLKLA
jgi:dTDP-glucose 4,6-dehydratase